MPDALGAVLVEARLVLRPHVLDLRLRDVGEPRGDREELLRLVGVDVEADARGAARRCTIESPSSATSRRRPSRSIASPSSSDLRAVAEQDRLRASCRRPRPGPLRARPAAERTARGLRGSTSRCPRAGRRSPARPRPPRPPSASAFICLGVFSSEVFAALSDSGRRTPKSSHLRRAVGDVPRPVADDRQDRPLDRPRDRRSTPTRPPARRPRRSAPVVIRGASGRPSEKPQKNWARIAPELPRAPPTAWSASVFDISRTCRWRIARDAGGDLLERRGDVGAGVAVGHREHVDLVEGLGRARRRSARRR